MATWTPEKLIVTLNALTHGNIKGWVDRLRLNPQAIGVPGEGCGQQNPLVCQPKIVFDDQSADLFYEIEAQFYPATIVELLPEWKWGDPPFQWRAQPGIIYAIPMTMGPEPYTVTNILSASSASDSPPALRRAALNLIAGDMTDARTGVQVTLDAVVSPGSFITPGSRPYYNVTMEKGHPSSEGRFSCPNWPR